MKTDAKALRRNKSQSIDGISVKHFQATVTDYATNLENKIITHKLEPFNMSNKGPLERQIRQFSSRLNSH